MALFMRNTNSRSRESVSDQPQTVAVSAALAEPDEQPAITGAVISERQTYLQQMKGRLHQQLVERLDVQNLRSLPPDVVRAGCRIVVRELCQSEKGLLSGAEQERLMEEVMDEAFGLGPLESILKDPTITDILVNRYDIIYIERGGRLVEADIRFRDNQHLRQIIDRIVAQNGRRIDETSP